MTNISNAAVTEKLNGHRVLLVGGAGFIGHNLALHLREHGTDVMILDNLMVNSVIDNIYASDREIIQRTAYQGFLMDRFRLLRDAGVRLHNGDARHLGDVSQAFEAFCPTKVVHMSAIASAVEARKDPGLCFDLQLLTLRNVLELARSRIGEVEQVMLMSSSTVYGDFEKPTVDENDRPRPRGIYANTKYMAERLIRNYSYQHGLGVTIVRPSALYGERCISRRVSQVFIENALTGKPLLLEGGGDGRLDFTYIRDLTDGIVRSLALHAGPGTSQTFNLTFGNARKVADLAAIIAKVVPNTIVEERPRAQDKPIRGTLSTDRAQEILGFQPDFPLEVGYLRYCEWYAEQWDRARHRAQSN